MPSKYAIEPYAQKRLPKYAIEPYAQKRPQVRCTALHAKKSHLAQKSPPAANGANEMSGENVSRNQKTSVDLTGKGFFG